MGATPIAGGKLRYIAIISFIPRLPPDSCLLRLDIFRAMWEDKAKIWRCMRVRAFLLAVLVVLVAAIGPGAAAQSADPAAPGTGNASMAAPGITDPASEPAPEPEPEPRLTLAAVGDLYLGGHLGRYILEKGPGYPWEGTRHILSAADLRLGNLEVMLSLKGEVYTPKQYTLRADPRTVTALVDAGFNVVSLANNHAMDFGPIALAETIELLDRHGIAHSGAGANLAAARAPAYLTVGGLRLAFLSYSLTYPVEFYAGRSKPGTAPGYESYLRVDIPAAKKQADLVIVSFHWSGEMLNFPKDYQRNIGRLSIDLGASLVVGHHPHVLQGFEVYRGGLIAYSLGNFAFGSLSSRVGDSAILLVDLDRQGPVTAWLYPINVNNYQVAFQPRLRTGQDAARAINEIKRFSAPFKTQIAADGDRGVIVIRPDGGEVSS